MTESEAHYAKEWRLRKALTSIKKAQEWNTKHPDGLANLMSEQLARDERIIRAELSRRKAANS